MLSTHRPSPATIPVASLALYHDAISYSFRPYPSRHMSALRIQTPSPTLLHQTFAERKVQGGTYQMLEVLETLRFYPLWCVSTGDAVLQQSTKLTFVLPWKTIGE